MSSHSANPIFFYKKRKILDSRTLAIPTFLHSIKFRYKTALSEANVKTNRMGSTKWTYCKGQSFTSNYLIFSKILCQLKKLV